MTYPEVASYTQKQMIVFMSSLVRDFMQNRSFSGQYKSSNRQVKAVSGAQDWRLLNSKDHQIHSIRKYLPNTRCKTPKRHMLYPYMSLAYAEVCAKKRVYNM